MSATSPKADPEAGPTDPGTSKPSREPSLANKATGQDSRRRIIDELIATGVPAGAAAGSGRRGRPLLASLYIIIPLLAIVTLMGLRESPNPAQGTPAGSAAERQTTSRGEFAISAQNISFDTNKLRLQAGAETVINFENRDASSIRHNVAIYEDEDANDPIFQGKIIPGGSDIDYEFTAPASGEYFFRCDVHPSMNGTVVVES